MFRIYNILYNNYNLLRSFYELPECLKFIEQSDIDPSYILIISPNGRHISFTKNRDIVFGGLSK